MQHLPLWYLGQVSPAVCDTALQDLLQIPPQSAKMGVDGEYENTQVRDTELRFAPPNHWFGGVLYEHGLAANTAAGWDYDITGHENLQLGVYGVGGHYGWHTDTFPLCGLAQERKISVICLLTDPSEYAGGELEVQLYQDYRVDMQRGQIIAFPSQLYHRVVPVTSGTRTSAVIWMTGPRMH
jgi:PKHD-type hydroxylase